jgi:murein DD-endopeptidase MepM/ murein hydrolase activator NlpD
MLRRLHIHDSRFRLVVGLVVLAVIAVLAGGPSRTGNAATAAVTDDSYLDLEVISPNGDNHADAVRIHHEVLTDPAAPQTHVIVNIEKSGVIVRHLLESDMPAGDYNWYWEGLADTGEVVADGKYNVVITTVDGAAVTEVYTHPIGVDRADPRVALTRSRTTVLDNKAMLAVPFRLNEAAELHVTLIDGTSRKSWEYITTGGKQKIDVRMPARLYGKHKSARLRVVIRSTDTGFNAGRSATYTIRVKARPQLYWDDAIASLTGPVRITWPLRAPISSGFGWRGGRMHEGIDLAAGSGTAIHAAAPGVVTYAGWMTGYGNLVIISHGHGITTRYGHQSKLASRVGMKVARGRVIGYVGSTGHSTGPHLHFEVRANNVAQNPLRYLP